MPLTVGEQGPWFIAATPSNPEYAFNTVAGRYILLAFLPREAAGRGQALRTLAANRALFDDQRIAAFIVARDDETVAGARDMRGLRWFLDPDDRIARLYGAVGEDGTQHLGWTILDPTLRVLDYAAPHQGEAVMRRLQGLPQPGEHAGVEIVAPVLIAPRIFEPEFCERLIALHKADGGAFTGVMRDVGDRTVAVMDSLKKRRDIYVSDPALQGEIRSRLERRLFPEMFRAFQFKATEIERYLIGCYSADDAGVFAAHRDNLTRGTANRRFACSINLNGGFEGGDLRFAEYGPATYRPPVGGAIVFSCTLLHEVTPITSGQRYAFLPFFFDQAGADILAAYRQSIADPAS
jgi:predicted 2-oxoglutarate/Fe(II)-dependent dioxygenase YbiX/peroxiredoxin